MSFGYTYDKYVFQRNSPIEMCHSSNKMFLSGGRKFCKEEQNEDIKLSWNFSLNKCLVKIYFLKLIIDYYAL